MNLVPTSRRLLLAFALFLLAFPWSFLLAQGFQQLLGDGAGRCWAALARALAWLAIPIALWFAYRYLTAAHCALFMIPVGLVAVSFLIPVPLWLLPNRAGMGLARAVSHAGAAAWLLACHLPFVHG
jgi:hypothetical protein